MRGTGISPVPILTTVFEFGKTDFELRILEKTLMSPRGGGSGKGKKAPPLRSGKPQAIPSRAGNTGKRLGT